MVHQHMAPPRQLSYLALIHSFCASLLGNRTHSCSTSSTIFDTVLSKIALIGDSCFSDPQVCASYMSIAVFKYLNHHCYGPLIANTFILQYQNSTTNTEISFSTLPFLYVTEGIEDNPFSNVTKIHWLCVEHHAIFCDSINQFY